MQQIHASALELFIEVKLKAGYEAVSVAVAPGTRRSALPAPPTAAAV